jgi:hypothetical protein
MRRPRPLRVLPALILAALAAPSTVAAQDFYFGAPRGSITLRVGRLLARSEGEVFDHTFRNLTVEPEDLNAFAVGVDLALRIAERADLVAGAGFSWTNIPSELIHWVEEDTDEPIRQTTSFSQVPLTLGARLYLTPRGRSISRFAWIPARAALYATAGAGVTHHVYEQEGDFVDEETLDIFTDELRSSGWAGLVYLGGGAQLRVSTRAALVAEARYSRGSGRAAGDFSGLDQTDREDIALGGLALSVGLAVTF